MDLKPATTCVVMADGKKEPLVLSFSAMWQLKVKRPEAYKTINRILIKGAEDVMDYLSLAYSAYLCANLDCLEDCETFKQFCDRAPEFNTIMAAVNDLVAPKKQAASVKPSAKRPAKAEAAE